MLIAVHYFGNSTRTSAKEELRRSAEINSELISRFYDEKARLAIALSEDPLVIKAAKEQADGLRGPNPSDVPITKISNETFNDIQRHLSELFKNWSDELENLFMGDVYGYAMADGIGGSSVKIPMNVEIRGGNYWKKTFEGNQVFGDNEFSPVPGHSNLVSVISIPIKDDKGVIASLCMPIDFTPIGKVIEKRKLGKTGYNLLVDRNGRLLLYPKKELVLNRKLSELKGTNFAKIHKKMLNRESGFDTFTQDDIKYYIYFDYVKPLGQYEGQGLSVGSIISEEELFEEANTMKKLMVLLTIVFITISFILSIVVSREITKPIKKLTEATKEISKGKLNERVTVNSNDEIGELASSFNQMTENLQKTTTSINNLNQEIAERKKTQEKYRTLFEGATDAIFIADMQTGILLDCNNEATKLIEKDKSQIIGQSHTTLHPEQEDPEQFYRTFEEHLREPDLILETQVITKTGRIKEVAIKTNILEIEGRKVLQGIFRDITAKKKDERELKKLNRDLKNTIVKVEEVNDSLKKFVYVASHDLREPLRKIISFGKILDESLSGNISEDNAENLGYMIEGAERMMKMIEGLLSYSRVSTQGQPAEVVDLNEQLKQLQELELSVLIEEKNVTIEIPEPLPLVKADPVQLRQLLQNLIANGIKYQKKDSTPHITVTSCPADDGMVKIKVADNGIGIKPEYQDKVFEMFRRLHSQNEYEGTGIGLSVCKKIVERQGGRISIESEYGKGSTFGFTIPVVEQPAATIV